MKNKLCYFTAMNKIYEKENIIEYCEIVKDIMNNPKVREMKQYPHHGKIDTHFHTVYVSYSVFRIAKKLKREDCADITRAALLHDFYLYDWHKTKHEIPHAWYHPKQAVINAEKYIGSLTKMQREMILYHMWPLAKTPRSVGGFILTFCDKHCADMDLIGQSKAFLPIYYEINRRCEAYD